MVFPRPMVPRNDLGDTGTSPCPPNESLSVGVVVKLDLPRAAQTCQARRGDDLAWCIECDQNASKRVVTQVRLTYIVKERRSEEFGGCLRMEGKEPLGNGAGVDPVPLVHPGVETVFGFGQKAPRVNVVWSREARHERQQRPPQGVSQPFEAR